MPLRSAACRLLLLLLAAAAATSAAAGSSTNSSAANCTFRDGDTVRAAFLHVTNFPLPLPGRRACRPLRRLPFPSRNLTGAVVWAALANLSSLLTVDLSGNALDGTVDAAFWRAPLLRAVDVSRNRLQGALRFPDDRPSARLAALNASGNGLASIDGVAALAGSLASLDVSRNAIGVVPEGMRNLTRVRWLDLSWNNMTGRFPTDLPQLDGLVFLNISYNNFSGTVDADALRKFGSSAFLHAGDGLQLVTDDTGASGGGGSKRKRKRVLTVALASAGAAVAALAILAAAACALLARGRRRRKRKDKDGKAAVWEDEEVAVGAVKVAAAAPVVVLERPLMELTLADLAAATSGFGRESQLAEAGARSGAAYRAVLPGDLHVVVRVVEGPVAGVTDDGDAAAAAAGLREIARLRHPNILPIFGYCIAGKQKLLLFEYMEKGDLHRWLHELPVGSMDTEDIGIDTMDALEDASSSRKPAGDWPTRFRIVLGVARGLAFLHQASIVHGHLVPTNVLLGDDMEPRISDFLGGAGAGGETAEGDVYRFGALLFELVSGQARWNDASTSWARGVIRNRKGLNLVDERLMRDESTATAAGAEAAEREIAECLQVGFLCTAGAPEKRPSMQQVVGLLKDIRPAGLVMP